MKTHNRRFKRTAVGILSIAVLSSTMLITTVSTSSAKKVRDLSRSELKRICFSSSGEGQLFDHDGGGYGCAVIYADKSVISIACSPEGKCSGLQSKDTPKAGPRGVKQDGMLKLRQPDWPDLCTRTTLGKLDPIIPILCERGRRNGSLIQK